jgi:diguanylate cyclase (GGDEF)-like protein
LSVTLVASVEFLYSYVKIKDQIDFDIKTEVNESMKSMQESVSIFMQSYAINDYENIIRSTLIGKNMLAIVVKDYSMGEITGEDVYISGFIKVDNDVEVFNKEDLAHQLILKQSYYTKSFDIEKENGKKLGEISFYISKETLSKELEYAIYHSLVSALVVIVLLIGVLFLTIDKFIIKKISKIIEGLSSVDEHGLPYKRLKKEGPSELVFLIHTINNMISTIKSSREQLRRFYEENRKQEQQIREKLQKFIDTQNSMLILSDGENLKYVNKTFLTFFGFETLEELQKEFKCVSQKFVQNNGFFHLGKIKEGEANWVESLLNLSGRQRVVSLLDKYSVTHAFSISINKYEGDDYVINFTDISDTITEKQELKREATIDELTGIKNRLYFNKHIEDILELHKKQGMKTGIIFFDIDHFKDFNDKHGHDMGDYVLKVVASIAKKFTRDDDKVIRWGGEEFIVVVKIDNLESLKKMAEHLRVAIQEHRFKNIDSVTCSFGCEIHSDKSDIATTIKIADEKLYEAKSSGRNIVIA